MNMKNPFLLCSFSKKNKMETFLIFPSFEEFVSKKATTIDFNVQGIIPFQSLKANIASAYLQNESIKDSIYVDISTRDDDYLSICEYLSIYSIVIQIDSSNLLQISSEILKIISISDSFKFFIVCNDLTVWLRFYQLIDASPNVRVCPILSGDPIQDQNWFITPMNLVILPPFLFDENNLNLIDDYRKMIQYMWQRDVKLVFMSHINKIDEIITKTFQSLSQIPQNPELFDINKRNFLEPEKESLVNSLGSSLQDKTVLITGSHVALFLEVSLELHAKFVMIYNQNPIELKKSQFIVQSMLEEIPDFISFTQSLLVDDQQKYDIVLSDFFCDFSLYPEISYFFKSFSSNFVPFAMDSVIMPVMTQAWYAISDKNVFYSLHPSVTMCIAPPQKFFHFSQETDLSQSKTIEFVSKISAVLNGFLVNSEIFLSKEGKLQQHQFTFIPLSRTVSVKENEKIILRIDRVSDGKNAFFQWCLLSPSLSTLQNPNGINSKEILKLK